MAFYNQESGVVSYDMELIEQQPEISGVKNKELAKKFITYFNSVLEDIIKENLFEKFVEWCDESEEMNSRIICETCSRDFTDECDDRSSFDEIGKVICMECFAKEDDRDGICEGCNENAGNECSNCDNIACSECIEEYTSDEDDKRCRICADDEPDTEDEECDEGCGTTLTEDTSIMCWVSKDKEEKTVCRACYDDCGYKKTDTNSDNEEEEEDLSFKKQYEKHLTDKENWNNIAPMKDWTPQDHKELDSYIKSGKLIASKQYPGSWIENEEEEEEYEFYDYGVRKVYKVVIQVAGGGMMNGNAYATVEGDWDCEDDFVNGEDGEIYYCEYGKYPKKDYRGNRLIFSDEGTGFNIE